MTNKDIILDFYRKVFDGRQNAADFVTADFEESYTGTMEETGVEGFYKRYAGFFAAEGAYTEIIKIVCDEEKVAAYIKMKKDGATFIRSCDIFHLRDGKICWHTAVIQPC